MPADDEKRNQKKGSLRCSYCQRSFTRTEHLARHERSHRNEKPFKCNYCESTFVRKDVIKRHHSRYHAGIPEVSLTVNPVRNTTVDILALATEETTSPLQPGQVALATADNTYMADYQDDSIVMQFMAQHSITSIDQIDTFLNNRSFPFMSNDLLLDSESFCEPLNGAINPALSATSSSPCSLSTKISQQDWRGSCEISIDKRNELEKEVQAAFSQKVNEADCLKLPSCLAFERLLITCFEIFLAYLPCIHVPTWKAESAHPTLLMAIASLGAGHNGDHDTAEALYRASRASVIRLLDSSYESETENQSVWLIQTIVILMCYGTSVGKSKSLSEAFSWASLLASLLRSQKIPESDDPEVGQDPAAAWKRWIDRETSVRTKCVGFLILNNLNICYNIAPALLNAEMENSFLPCCESVWAATTPTSWLKAWSGLQLRESRFKESLNFFISPSVSEAIKTTSFGAYVMLHAIIQRMWRLQPESWVLNDTWSHYQTSYMALQKWQASWEEDPECSVSSPNPHGAVSSNAAALLRLAHMRLHTDFSPVRSAMVSLDAAKVAQSMKELSIKIDRSNSSLKTAIHALQALRTRVRLGMVSKAPNRIPPHSLQIHLVSIECCLFASAWVREVSSRSEYEQTFDEKECIRLVQEVLAEADIGQSNAQKSISTQLVYAWTLVFECCAVWGIQSIIAEAFKRYAESLPD